MKLFRSTFFILAIALFIQTTFAQVKADSGLVACYPFSGDANDHSGHNNHGTVHGSTICNLF